MPWNKSIHFRLRNKPHTNDVNRDLAKYDSKVLIHAKLFLLCLLKTAVKRKGADALKHMFEEF